MNSDSLNRIYTAKTELDWRVYNGCLMPQSDKPIFIDLLRSEARKILSNSKALMMLWNSDPVPEKSPWYYVICEEYNQTLLHRKMRNQIKRGYKHCTVKRISAEWFAEHGYECYLKSLARYGSEKPIRQQDFYRIYKNKYRVAETNQFWGVFLDHEQLVGVTLCQIFEETVCSPFIYFDPDSFQYYPSYALIDTLLSEYVTNQGLIFSNGTRSVSHETSFQDFLLKFNFYRLYCRLNVEYVWSLKILVTLTFPMKNVLAKFKIFKKLKAVLLIEQIRRECHQIFLR